MNPSIEELTEGLEASYQKIGGINHLDGQNLPSKTAVASITCKLLQLLFPGFFDDRLIHSSQLTKITCELLTEVRLRLADEVSKSLLYCPPGEVAQDAIQPLAQKITADLLASLPCLRELLQTDVEAAYNGDPAALSSEEVIVAYPSIEAIAVQRLAHELYLKQVPLIPRIMTEWAHGRTGMDLHPGAEIGAYFFVDHGTGTVVGETSQIGDHVKLYQGVGLVARSLSGGQALRGQKRHPSLEDHVTVYAGATIMGGDTVVGSGSTVGANVFLTHSVPARSLVLQEDARVKVMRKSDRPVDFQI